MTRKGMGVGRVMRVAFIGMACCVALFFLKGCGGNEPKLVSNQTTVANTNAPRGTQTQANANANAAGASAAPAKGGTGDYIDTSEYDARINKLEEQSKKKPDDKGVRKKLAEAYLERGNALTQARQYQAALGDYRRTLRLDPANEEARRWSDIIIGILNQMNRPVPAEGTEPTPLKQ